MAQVRQIPMRSIPDPGRLRASSSTDLRRSQSLRNFEPPIIPRSPFRTTQTQSIGHSTSFIPTASPRRLGSSSTLHRQTRFDPLTGLTRYPSESESIPMPPPRSLENLLHHPEQTTSQIFDQTRLDQQLHEAEELLDIPMLDDDDGLPVVSLENRNLPVYARFPFDVTFLPQPMETNVEDNIHRLRLRLIDSDSNQQRQSANDYSKRTQDQSSLPSSKTKEGSSHYYQTRPPSNSFAHQRGTPKRTSRQGLYTPLPLTTNPGLSGAFPRLSRGRVGIDYEPQSHVEIERDLEIRQMQESLYNGRSSTYQPVLISNYSYDPRLHAAPATNNSNILERQYTSSNMDDLIDSMARRHLAYRRYDGSLDRQRMGSRGYPPVYESGITARQASLLNQYRHDDPMLTHATTSNSIEPGYPRSYPTDVSLHVQPRYNPSYRRHTDLDHNNLEHPVRTNSYSRLPPISPTLDTRRFDRSMNLSNSALYRAKHQTRPEPRTNPAAVPLSLPDHTEHYIELPSDIFLTTRTDAVGSSHRQNPPPPPPLPPPPLSPHPPVQPQQQTTQTKSAPIHREKTGTTYDSEHEPIPPPVTIEVKKSPRTPPITKEDKSEQVDLSLTGTDPFVKTAQKKKFQRKLFRKVALAVLFLRVLKRRATRTRLTRPVQSSSATIHKIRLQEIQVALHRVYLEPDGPIYNALVIAITSSIDLKDALNSSAVNHSAAIHIISEALKNVISKIVDFMPKDGVLGTTKTSSISALIQDGNPFPENYFWQCEKQRLEFKNNKIINITKQRAVLLLIGVFIFRSLITTLLLKPIKYRLMLGELTPRQMSNLKVLASTMFYVSRRTAGLNSQILTLPQEWESLLYNDNDLKPLLNNNDMKPIMTKCELSLSLWCEEYIRRIDTSFGKELRP